MTNKQLLICKFKDKMFEGDNLQYYKQHQGKVYIFHGEFNHAKGHCLLSEMGNEWKFEPGMIHIDELEFLDQHPGDFVVHLDNNDFKNVEEDKSTVKKLKKINKVTEIINNLEPGWAKKYWTTVRECLKRRT